MPIRTNLDRLREQAEAVERRSREEDPELASDVRNILQRMQALQQKKAADNTKYAKAYETAVLDPLNKFAQGTGQKKIKVRQKLLTKN